MLHYPSLLHIYFNYCIQMFLPSTTANTQLLCQNIDWRSGTAEECWVCYNKILSSLITPPSLTLLTYTYRCIQFQIPWSVNTQLNTIQDHRCQSCTAGGLFDNLSSMWRQHLFTVFSHLLHEMHHLSGFLRTGWFRLSIVTRGCVTVKHMRSAWVCERWGGGLHFKLEVHQWWADRVPFQINYWYHAFYWPSIPAWRALTLLQSRL